MAIAKSQNNLEVKFLQKVQGIILDNLANEDFKVEPHLWRAMTMSRPQLYRKLKALKNCSPSDLIKHLRMQEAQRLLTQRELSISEIAEQVGFKNPSYFTKVHSDTFGEAPSQAFKRFWTQIDSFWTQFVSYHRPFVTSFELILI